MIPNPLTSHSILDCHEWTPHSLEQLFDICNVLKEQPPYCPFATNKILVNVFFEPSTRTSMSFESAMYRLNGNVMTFYPSTSSIKKGENDMDTIDTLVHYGDAIVLRHPKKEFIQNVVKKYPNVPIINGGNGDGDHPTQALVDLYTLYKTYGNDFKKKRILFVGDVRHSRTIHSFVSLLNLYPETKLYFYPYYGCEPDTTYMEAIAEIHNQSLDDVIISNIYPEYKNYDVVYITREQKERHVNTTTQENHYCFTNLEANKLPEDAIIMHPLPRNRELHEEVDTNPRACYMKQVEYSVILRMALLECVFQKKKENTTYKKEESETLYRFKELIDLLYIKIMFVVSILTTLMEN